MKNFIVNPHNISLSNKGNNDIRLIAFSFIISVVYFTLEAYLFPTQFRPDEQKARDFFSLLIVGRSFDIEAEPIIRLVLFSFNIIIVAFLFCLKLIDKRTMLLGASWPLTIFMFSKIYWEFYVFPLYLIKINTTLREEYFVLVAIAVLYAFTSEANLLVFLAFRCVLFAQKIGLKLIAPLGFIALGAIISLSFESGLHKYVPFIGSELERFAWTREVANPEYSVFETIAVFLSSMHFFTLHTGLWWIDLIFTLTIISVVVLKSPLSITKFTAQPEILAFISVLLTMTEITHVFQNARYYLFFIPVMALMVSEKTIGILAWIGLLHVILKSFEAL
ncbi:hypothetical protein [Cobetia sp. UCD-24C]|uniref:hypothetical protein n=1 Tax=Cobetia sp. UCD-24C TaxID=1716176 RepID=UPI00128EC926|nr:hypothetical protein [Cobetia sp. UCD-24C]